MIEKNKTKFLGDQEKVFNTAVHFAKNEVGILLIKGKAGTGKTKVVQFIIEELVLTTNSKKVGMLAPTGQAVKVCVDNADLKSDRIMYSTIHSAYAMIPQKNMEKLTFKQNPKGTITANDMDILFVDEVSMLDNFLYGLIRETSEKIPVILIGDEGQIPPINHSYAAPFLKEYQEEDNIKVVDMVKPIRQKNGNPILDLATIVYNNRKKSKIGRFIHRTDNINIDGEAVIHISENDEDDMYGIVEDFFTSKENTDVNYVKLLAWRNKTVDYWNTVIRRMVYGDLGKSKLVVGEKLLSDAPYMEEDAITGTTTMIFSTNETLEVKSIDIDYLQLDDDTSIKYYSTTVEYYDYYGNTKLAGINILHEESETLYQDILKLLADEAKELPKNTFQSAQAWGKFWEFKETFLPVSYNYAKTVHKSQGSTYKHVIVIEDDILVNRKNEERNRILYVACSRATKTLVLAN